MQRFRLIFELSFLQIKAVENGRHVLELVETTKKNNDQLTSFQQQLVILQTSMKDFLERQVSLQKTVLEMFQSIDKTTQQQEVIKQQNDNMKKEKSELAHQNNRLKQDLEESQRIRIELEQINQYQVEQLNRQKEEQISKKFEIEGLQARIKQMNEINRQMLLVQPTEVVPCNHLEEIQILQETNCCLEKQLQSLKEFSSTSQERSDKSISSVVSEIKKHLNI